MAVRTVKIDDIDGKSEGADTIIFGAAGEWFQIDLVDANAKKLTDALAPFMDKGSPINVRDALKVAANGQDFDPQVVRAWAQRNGKQVNDRGRVSRELVEEWKKAQGG